jgi:DNA recombination protein RmuC
MIDLSSTEFFLGIILGLLLGLVVKSFFSKKEIKDNTDDYAKNLKELEKKIQEYQTTNSEDRGAVQTLLTLVNTGQTKVVEEAEKIANTFISGGGQRQGVWGEMVLNNILTNNLGFKEGREFVTQENYSTNEGNLQPDVIINFPDGRSVIVDAKVSLTAWDEYANSSDETIKEQALKRHKQSLKNHIDNLNGKNYQGIKDLNTLDTIIMFCPNEKAISELPDEGGKKLMEYALSKKVTLCVPSMLFYTLKVAEYFWNADKQSKNISNVIELATKISNQAVDIYASAKKAEDAIKKTSDGVAEVMEKIKDGRGSFLSKVSKMNRIGGLTPKKIPPSDVGEDDDNEEEKIKSK